MTGSVVPASRSSVSSASTCRDGGHPVRAQGEHLLQRRTRPPVARHPRRVGHLVVGQVERVPGRRLAQQRAPHPGVGGEHEMAQRLDERPLALDPFVRAAREPCPGPGSTVSLPQPLEDGPRLAEPVGVGRPHLHPVGVAAVELGLHQRHDVDAVDPEVLDLAADVHVDHLRAADHDPAEVHELEPRAGEVDVAEGARRPGRRARSGSP